MSELLDNRRYRLDRLKAMIRRLHDGEDPETLKEEFSEIIGETGATEISALETELMREGMPQEEIQRMCDVHAALFRDSRAELPDLAGIAGHPANTLKLENDTIRELVSRFREALGRYLDGPEAEREGAASVLRETVERLRLVDGHYQRKELLLFPFLEKAGLTGPPKVMWGVDDEIRELVKAGAEIVANLESLAPEELELARDTVLDPMLEQLESMADKEDRILVPMLAEHLSPGDWSEIAQQWRDLGPMLVEPRGVWLPVLGAAPAAPEASVAPDEAIRFPSGHLTPAQLEAIFKTMPFDLTFVDADDRVAFFSEGPDRVFERSRTIIGRKVENCHPPKSLHIVQRVVTELRTGVRDVAEFWIEMGGRFVHIRYFAVRSDSGEYLGTLEVTQDVTAIRALEGERRLLDEEDAS